MGGMGYRGMGGHRNKASGDKIGHTGHAFGPMAGDISPKCMKVEFQTWRDADGCGWAKMGSDGCSGTHAHEGDEKQDKQRHKYVCRACFSMHSHGKKKQEVVTDARGGQRGSLGGNDGKARGV